ncbi:MAG: hypothetical protein RLZZ458_1739 [Planctomycetota bacterium]
MGGRDRGWAGETPAFLDEANRPHPESCVGVRKAFVEALTGSHAGQPLSCEISPPGRLRR